MNKRAGALVVVAMITGASAAVAQQEPDRGFRPPIGVPAYPVGAGPVVCLDEGHYNFHTLEGRFWAFGELLRRDGYVVRALRSRFDPTSLQACRVLVISNAQPSDRRWDQYGYPTPSAFTAQEIGAVREWVEGGSSLLLIADHMPLAGAAAELAAAFDVTFLDGFAVEGFAAESERDAAFAKPTLFRLEDGTLRPHAIVRGRLPSESVTSVRSFTGQAFRAPAGAEPLMVLPETFISLQPDTAWQFGPSTRRVAVGGWLQAAVMRVGSGKVAFFGEAAMFSAQVSGPGRRPMGMNAPGAEQNAQFVANVVRWLSGALDAGAGR